MGVIEGAKVPRTLKALLRTPGLLTEEVLAGRGAQWTSPLQLFVLCSLAYFLVVPAVDGIVRLREERAAQGSVAGTGADGVRLGLTPEARAQLDLLGARRVLGDERFELMADDLGALNERVTGALAVATPLILLALMPMFALLTWLAWRDGGLRYGAHWGFALHVHAAWFAALVPAKLAELTGSILFEVAVGVAVIAYSTWYCIAAFKRVLGGTPSQLFTRSSIVGLAYGIWVLAIAFATMAYVILTY